MGLDSYEDWRLPVEERAQDLASKMSIERIAGLMLYSAHQSIPGGGNRFFGPATYNVKAWQRFLCGIQCRIGRTDFHVAQ